MSLSCELEQTSVNIRRAFRLRKATRRYEDICQQTGINVVTLSRFNRGEAVQYDTLLALAHWVDATSEEAPSMPLTQGIR